jgi:hypothetical protein
MTIPHAWAANGDPSPGQSGNDAPDSTGTPEPTLPAWAQRKSPMRELSDENLAVFIGPRWEPTYRRKLAPFRDDPAFVPTWNWAAALFGAFWFLYRKLYLAFAVFMLASMFALRLFIGSDVQVTGTTLLDPANRWLLGMQIALGISSLLAHGGSANWFLYRRARAAIRLVALQSMPEEESRRLLARIGGVNRGGLVFLLVVYLVLGLATAQA